jgi:hypothetical protein
MKVIFTIILMVCSLFCNAQSEQKIGEENRSFNLAMQSRGKADIVFNLFDTIYVPKLLYSIEDEHYIVVIKNAKSFSEYYIHMNPKGKIKKVCLLNNLEDKSELLIKGFELEKYSSEFLIDSRNILSAKKYFVIKDKNGNRYGECSVLSLPFVHIDENLSMYLAIRLTKIIN